MAPMGANFDTVQAAAVIQRAWPEAAPLVVQRTATILVDRLNNEGTQPDDLDRVLMESYVEAIIPTLDEAEIQGLIIRAGDLGVSKEYIHDVIAKYQRGSQN